MPNSIDLAQAFIPMLDERYQMDSLTSELDGAPELARVGANANELIIPKLDMQGLGEYDRNGGYINGDVTLTHETVTCNFDRGRMFVVDNMDNQESAGIAFGRLAAEFIRTKVAPEVDAFRFASYASLPDINSTEETINTGDAIVKALRRATNVMDEAEIPENERYLYITPTLHGIINDLDTTKSKAVMERFAKIVRVPQARFYTKINQRDGKTAGQEAGGFAKAEDGANINFMVIHKPAIIQFTKHVAPKIVTPEQNQDADAWKFGYRLVGIAKGYENKRTGIYVNKAASAA